MDIQMDLYGRLLLIAISNVYRKIIHVLHLQPV